MNHATQSKRSRLVLSVLLLLAAASTSSFSTAQDQARLRSGDSANIKPCTCSNPVNIVIDKTSGTTSGNKADFPANFAPNQMTYNDKTVNKHFTDTISWRLPKDVCETTIKATWTVRNNGKDGLQSNDTTGLWLNAAQLVGHQIGGLPTGGTKTYSYTLTPAQAKAGRVSLAAQDDTAVIDFKVEVTGCCIAPN